MVRFGAIVICPLDLLFTIFIKELKNDNCEFFELLYHMEFKETIHSVINSEGRSLAHLSTIFKAEHCYRYFRDKFKINMNLKDRYGKNP